MTVRESYSYCSGVARRRAKNFYYSFLLLPREQRDAMCAMYAFMRYCDDLSDDPSVTGRATAMARWERDLELSFEGELASHPVWPAFHDAVTRFRIPPEYFREMIAGVRTDLEPRRIETFEELYRYCYHVSSVVGLIVIHIFGFDSPDALPLAEKCGIAFQLTNILRDVREDAERDRIYLPLGELAQFQVDSKEFLGRARSENYLRLMRFQAERARRYYRESAPLVSLVHRRSRPSLWALCEVYSRLLDRIEASNFDVLGRRVSVPMWEKLWILGRAHFGAAPRSAGAWPGSREIQ